MIPTVISMKLVFMYAILCSIKGQFRAISCVLHDSSAQHLLKIYSYEAGF